MPEKNVKNKGFTLIETLVAITILLIAIAGPLTIAEKGLTEAVSSQDQLTASYLAQDLMEYIKNVRDDNMLANPNPSSWLVSPNGFDLSSCVPLLDCNFDTVLGMPTAPVIAACSLPPGTPGGCHMYIATTSEGATYYTYYSPANNAATPITKFIRTVTVALPPGTTSSTATSSIVTVTVTWKTGTVANKVVLQDILFNTLR